MSLQRLLVAAILFSLAAAAFIFANSEPFGRIFWHLLSEHDLPATWLMIVMLVTAYALTLRAQSGNAWGEQFVVALDRHRYAIALALFIGLCAGTLWIYSDQPLSMDEYTAVFQAKVFAAGALHGQFPPELMDQLILPGFQNHFLMVNRVTGTVISAYWPGFSLLLTPFVWLGIPWACNPTLVALSTLLIARIARELGGPTAAGWAMLLALASPAFVGNGITYYSMPAHLLFNLTFAWLLLVPTPCRALLAGLVGGFALTLHNPFPHAAFALPWLVWMMWRREQRWRHLAWLALGYGSMVLPLLMGWSMLHKALLLTPATISSIENPTIVLEPDWLSRVASLLKGFLRFFQWPDEMISYARLGGLVKLWLWAAPMLLLLAWWGGRCSSVVGTRLLGASALTTFFAYFLIRFDQGHGWGYRYFHPAWGVLPILGALGVAKLVAERVEGVLSVRPLIVVALTSLMFGNGMRFYQMKSFMDEHLAHFPPSIGGKAHLVMHNARGYYAFDLIQNDPWLRGDRKVFVVMSSADTDAILAKYPGYRFEASNRYGETYVATDSAP